MNDTYVTCTTPTTQRHFTPACVFLACAQDGALGAGSGSRRGGGSGVAGDEDDDWGVGAGGDEEKSMPAVNIRYERTCQSALQQTPLSAGTFLIAAKTKPRFPRALTASTMRSSSRARPTTLLLKWDAFSFTRSYSSLGHKQDIVCGS